MSSAEGNIEISARESLINNLIDSCFRSLYDEDYEVAIGFCSKALSLCGNDTLSLYAAKAYNALGCILARQRNTDIDKVSGLFLKSLEIYHRHGMEQDAIMVYSNLGNYYDENAFYDEALFYYSKAYSIILSQETPSVHELCLVLMNMAYVNEIIGNGVLAEQYYIEALNEAQATDDSSLQNHVRVNLADFLFSVGKLDEAEHLIRISMKENLNLQVNIRLHELLIAILKRKGRFAEACHYYEVHNLLTDSLRRNEKDLSTALLRAQLENYEKEQAGFVQQQQLEEERLRVKKRTYWVVGLGGLGLAVLSFLFLRLRRQARINSELRKHYALQEESYSGKIEKLSEAISSQNREIASKLFYLLKVRGLQDELLEKMLQLEAKVKFSPSEKLLVLDMVSILRQLHDHRDGWDEFEYYFQQVDQNFLKRLQEKFPGLSPNEKRLCALISLHLSTKEIALVTNKSFDAVRLSKIRLKRKFGLDKNTTIYDFLSELN